MAEQPLPLDEISLLAAAFCDGTIDAAGFVRLEQWLANDPAARQWYIDYMDLHDELCADHVGGLPRHPSAVQDAQLRPLSCAGARTMMNAESRMANCRTQGRPRPRPCRPVIPHSSFIIHHFFKDFGAAPTFSYAMAVLILAAGAVAAHLEPGRRYGTVRTVCHLGAIRDRRPCAVHCRQGDGDERLPMGRSAYRRSRGGAGGAGPGLRLDRGPPGDHVQRRNQSDHPRTGDLYGGRCERGIAPRGQADRARPQG